MHLCGDVVEEDFSTWKGQIGPAGTYIRSCWNAKAVVPGVDPIIWQAAYLEDILEDSG